MSLADQEFLTLAEVASLLKLNQQTILKKWIDDRKLPAIRIGRRVRIPRSDFDRFVDSAYTGASDTPPVAEQGFWDGNADALSAAEEP